jgi:hypothetical protein
MKRGPGSLNLFGPSLVSLVDAWDPGGPYQKPLD